MPNIPRNLIVVAALLVAAAIIDHRAMAWSRTISPIQRADVHAFPTHLAGWTGVDYESEMTQSTRAYFGTDNFLDRIYSRDGEYPIELVLLPTGSGLHSPKICARFGGIQLLSSTEARPHDPSDADRIVLRTANATNTDYACSYFWRTPDGVVHEPKAYVPASHYTDSVMVSLCTPLEGSDNATRFRKLDEFRSIIEPEVVKMIGGRSAYPLQQQSDVKF